jgi:hypothetical protein
MLFSIPFSEVVKVFLDPGLLIQDEQDISYYRGYIADHYAGFKYSLGTHPPHK